MKNKMTCVVLDDEPGSLNLLVHYVKNHPQLELLQSFTYSIEAMAWLRENKVDLLITDIDMDEIDGIDLVHSLIRKPLVILCTGHPEFSLRAHEVSPVDFLIKPIRYDSFMNAVEKAALRLGKHWKIEGKRKLTSNFVVEVETGHLVRLDVEDIKYIEAKENNVIINCLSYSVTTRNTLKNLLTLLPGDDFMQVHRSFAVALALIYKLKEGSLLLMDVNEEIPLGSKYAQHVRDYIADMNLKRASTRES